MFRQLSVVTAMLLALTLVGCASQPAQSGGVTFVIVRHAEKADDGSKDPPLNAEGAARAEALAASLSEAPLRAVYATQYRRAQATAAPAAREQALPVMAYDPKLSAAGFAAQLRRDHATGTVLVVGHSNTVPDIASALCACVVAAMDEAEYDRRITITFDARGRAAMHEDRY